MTTNRNIGVSLAAVVDAAGAENAVDASVDKAREAAELGLDAVWFGQRFDYDAIALAGFVGREVPGIAVGTSAVPIFGRHPLLVAAQARTSQAAAHGHFTLGLALGAPGSVESVLGVPYERPIARLRDFLTVVRQVVETESADFHGEILTAASPTPLPLAGARPPVPLLVAAMGPQALRATGELADGTLPLFAGPRAIAEHIVPEITRAAERAGRPAPRIIAGVAAVVTGGSDDVVAAAREAAATQTAFYDRVPSYRRIVELSGARRVADLVVIGDEETVAAELRRYFDAGATELLITQTQLAGETARRRTWRLLGELAAG